MVIVSHNSKRWLKAALTSVASHLGTLAVDTVVVDNGSDGAAEYAERELPGVRSLRCPNRGFGHANNWARGTVDAPFVLFLNPDTEVLAGEFSHLVAVLARHEHVGLLGVRQLHADGSVAPTIRRFPSISHNLAEAVGVGGVPVARRFLGERVFEYDRYRRETICDWVSGSFMLARREALDQIDWFDERFFLFSEETDLCWRLGQAGWSVLYVPDMTIRHYESDAKENPWLEAQLTYSRLQFARKHFSQAGQIAYRLALVFRYALRIAAYATIRRKQANRRRTVRAAFHAAITGRPPSPPSTQTARA